MSEDLTIIQNTPRKKQRVNKKQHFEKVIIEE